MLIRPPSVMFPPELPTLALALPFFFLNTTRELTSGLSLPTIAKRELVVFHP